MEAHGSPRYLIPIRLHPIRLRPTRLSPYGCTLYGCAPYGCAPPGCPHTGSPHKVASVALIGQSASAIYCQMWCCPCTNIPRSRVQFRVSISRASRSSFLGVRYCEVLLPARRLKGPHACFPPREPPIGPRLESDEERKTHISVRPNQIPPGTP